jgi:predicted nucleotidyltransferase
LGSSHYLMTMQRTKTTSPRPEKTWLAPVTPELLADVVDRIVGATHPDRIILFGSQARGAARATSDIDLFIVKAGVVDQREVAREIYELLDDIPRDFDILVATPEGVDCALAAGNSFVRVRVLGEGTVLYERPAA